MYPFQLETEDMWRCLNKEEERKNDFWEVEKHRQFEEDKRKQEGRVEVVFLFLCFLCVGCFARVSVPNCQGIH